MAGLMDPFEPLPKGMLKAINNLEGLPEERLEVSWPWCMCIVACPAPDPWLVLEFLPMLVRHSPLEGRARNAWELEEYP
jgi:hypothetical protein